VDDQAGDAEVAQQRVGELGRRLIRADLAHQPFNRRQAQAMVEVVDADPEMQDVVDRDVFPLARRVGVAVGVDQTARARQGDGLDQARRQRPQLDDVALGRIAATHLLEVRVTVEVLGPRRPEPHFEVGVHRVGLGEQHLQWHGRQPGGGARFGIALPYLERRLDVRRAERQQAGPHRGVGVALSGGWTGEHPLSGT
jgi:hypothetical protein